VESKIPEVWRKSFVVPIFKEKGDIQKCGHYRVIKLISRSMKIWENIIDKKIRDVLFVTRNQFGLMLGPI